MSTTTEYSITVPTVNGSPDTWGTLNNAAHESWDGLIKANETAIGAKLAKTGGTLTGALIGTTGSFPEGLTGALTGNASSATILENPRNISLGGIMTGSASFDGSSNINISAAIADGVLSIAKTSGLQTALSGKQATGDYPIHASGAGRKLSVSSTEPTSPTTGDIWFEIA